MRSCTCIRGACICGLDREYHRVRAADLEQYLDKGWQLVGNHAETFSGDELAVLVWRPVTTPGGAT